MLTRFRQSLEEAQARLLDPEALDETLRQLVREGALEAQRAESLRVTVRGQLGESRYVMGHLGAHLAIGAVFAFDVVPLPLGTIGRVSWVGGARIVEELRRNRAHARVHSLGVLLLAAVPWVGYAAYLLPLRRTGSELAFVLANQSWLSRTGDSYEQFLIGARAPVRRVGRWLVPHPGAAASAEQAEDRSALL